MEIVRTENIEKIYDENGIPVHALRGITMAVETGEFLVIAGPSGSGKTTLLNIIGALDVPTKGTVFLEGEDIGRKGRNEVATLRLTRLGFVFQAYNLIPVLTALENIEFTMMLCGIAERERHQRARALMEELGIGGLADKRPNEMSGGQQQRVAVARAMVNNPSLILADEPTANLDSETAGMLLDMMERMNQEKKLTFIFSSHDAKVIDRARRLLVLKDGRIENDRQTR
jgi:putative ABC transport system ATP-binding protein